MRALGCFALVASLVAGCGKSATDPCKGVAGTCVSLTVESTTVAAVDSLHILASGALTGDQTSSGGRANLPIVVALKLPADTSGSLDLHVDGFLTATLVGSCDTDTLVTPGQHATAICTLMGVDNLGGDMAIGGGEDLAGSGGPDMVTPPCDPKGVTGPQCVWRWQSPLPQGDDITSLVAFDDANTFMLSVDGILFHRDATGWTMLPAKPTATGGFLGLSSLFGGGAGMDLYAAGAISGGSTTSVVFHSTDRGATWSQEALSAGATVSLGQGATTGKAAIVPAQSGGNIFVRDATAGTWSTRLSNNVNATYYATAMNANGAVIVGSVSGTMPAASYSTDTINWTSIPVANFPASTPALTGVCVGANGTTNSYWAVGGAFIVHGAGNTPGSWTQQGAAASAGKTLTGCVATDATHAWAFGAGGVVLVTTDGVNWASVASPPVTGGDALQAGAHSSGTALTIGGTDGVLYRSTNAGASFTAERTGPADFLDAVYGVAPGVVYAVGQSGVIDKSTNDGATWTSIPAAMTGSTAQLTGVWGASATDVYAVGSQGTIIHSSDGTTFTKYGGANLPTATTLFEDVWGSPTLGVYAVGYDTSGSNTSRIAYRTTDHGVTWTPVNIAGFTGVFGSGNLLFTAFALGSDVWVAGDKGNVYHSTDGTTFTAQNTGITNLAISRMRGVNGLIIALIANDPGFYISTVNNGVSWTAPTTMPLNDSPQNIAFTPDQSAIYVFGSFAGPIASFDKDATWSFVPTVMNPNTVRSAFAFAANDVFIVGDTGIIHYGN